MKARETFVLALVISLALVPVLVSVPVRAQGQYNERLDVYVAGSSAYWLMDLNRLNSTVSGLSSAEATAGLSSYRLLAFSAQAATSDMQVFGVDGYNLLDVPSLPSQGLFLMANASSTSAASPLVSFFSTRFATTFTLISAVGSSYVYYAPVDFAGVAAPVLYRLVPTTMKGFASFLTEGTFSGLVMPSIGLTGVNNGSGFSHTITIGAAASSVINSTGSISVPQILSEASGVLTASSSASSSVVMIHALDGVIKSSDKATVTNNPSNLSGTYKLTAVPGAKVKVNATIASQPQTAIAYREFDRSTLSSGQSVAVTIVVKNTASSGSLQNFTINDNWWQSFPSVFQFQSGNYSVTIPSIVAGSNVTESYVLKVISSTSQQITVPAATASFQYLLSSTSYRGDVTLNQAVLQVNNVGPAVDVSARATVSSGVPLGTQGNFTVTLINGGNSPALNVKVGGTTISSLAQGATQTVSIPVTLSGLVQTNFTETIPVQFTNSAQQTVTISSNSVSLVMSHSGMAVPYVQLSTSDTLTGSGLASRLLNVTYSFVNAGTGTAGAVVSTQTLPAGVVCKAVSGTGGVCGTGTFTATIAKLAPQGTQAYPVELTFSADNFVVAPSAITVSYEGATLHAFGGAYVIPAGVEIAKSFGPNAGFPGMTSSVTLGIVNAGSTPVYNATLISSQDTFDSLQSGATTYKTYSTLAPQQSESFNYTVALSSGFIGNETSTPASVTLVLGGLTAGFTSPTVNVDIYKPVTVSLSTSPSAPEENHQFTLSVTFTNSAGVAVTDATYSFTIPSGLTVVSGGQLSGRTVSVSSPSLGPHSNQTVVVTLSASAGVTIDTSSSHVTFQYQGSSVFGIAPKQTITVAVDVTTRYTLPIIVAVLIALAGLVYMRRRINPHAAS